MMDPRRMINFAMNFNTVTVLNFIDAANLFQEQMQSAIETASQENPFFTEEMSRFQQQWLDLNRRNVERLARSLDQAGKQWATLFTGMSG